MTIGTVKFFNTSKGFGFIAPDGGGKDVFVHATAVEAAGMRTLNEGQKVSFDIQPDMRGAKATNLGDGTRETGNAYYRGVRIQSIEGRSSFTQDQLKKAVEDAIAK